MKILSVSSQVAYGPVGNSAAVPALQARRHEVLAIPTIMLSNHPGHGKPAGFRTAPDDMAQILETLHGLGALTSCGAALTGYFASAEQIQTVENVLIRMKLSNPDLYVLVDPVIGDDAGLYVPQAVAEAVRDRLVPLATCITPNRFELAWLSGHPVTDEASAIAAAQTLGIAEVLATSVPAGEQLATLLVTGDGLYRNVTPRLAHVPNGTGDFLSGLYLASRLDQSPEDAFLAAMKTLVHAIAISAGTAVLDVAGALHGMAQSATATSVLGIDMCRGAWCVVKWDGLPDSVPTTEIVQDISKVDFELAKSAAIDIPIGFPDIISTGGRTADQEARKFLRGRGPVVFPAPCRDAIHAKTNAEASRINRKNSETGMIGVPAVTFGLFNKLREVDAFVSPQLQSRIFEVHPEVSFAIMNNGRTVLSDKKEADGQEDRRSLLRLVGFPIDNLRPPAAPRGRWGWDDVLDACACAWTAKRIAEGTARRFPANPPLDARGLRMEINA